MKKVLLSTCSALAVATTALTGVAFAQEEGPDNRSAWAKSQDMYVEPTLRISETTVRVTPEQAAQQNLRVREVPAGTAVGQVTTVFGPDGQVLRQEGVAVVAPASTQNVAPSTDAAATPQSAPQSGANINDLSRALP